MSTNYPGALDTFVNPTATDALDSATVPHAAQHDNINDAMSAVQVTLGVNPQGSSATVVARLTALDSTVSGKAATNQTMYVGTTAIAINRSSSSQTLTGVDVDGNAATVTNGVYKNVANTFTTGTQIIATGSDSTVGFRIKRNSATQSANIFEITQSDGTSILASINSAGNVFSPNVNGTTSLITGLVSGGAGSVKIYGSAIGSSVTITPPTLSIGGTANQVLPTVAGTIVSTGMTGANAQVVSNMISGTIADSKLDTISTAGKISNSATTATNANTASAIVARDASGNFTAGTITAALNAGSGSVTAQTVNVNQGSTPTAVFKGASSSFSTTVRAQSDLAAANTATLPSSTGTILTDADTIATTQLNRTGSGTNVVTDTSPTITTASLTTPTVTNLKTANEIYKFQAAPTSVTTAITAAQLIAGLITSTPGVLQNSQLPTGSSLQAVWAASSGYAVEWSYINLGTFNATITTSSGSTNTMVTGNNAVIAPGTSGRFLTKNTATNTFLTYRLA